MARTPARRALFPPPETMANPLLDPELHASRRAGVTLTLAFLIQVALFVVLLGWVSTAQERGRDVSGSTGVVHAASRALEPCARRGQLGRVP